MLKKEFYSNIKDVRLIVWYVLYMKLFFLYLIMYKYVFVY